MKSEEQPGIRVIDFDGSDIPEDMMDAVDATSILDDVKPVNNFFKAVNHILEYGETDPHIDIWDNNITERNHYTGRDAVAFSGGKDSVTAAILSKITQGKPPILFRAEGFDTDDDYNRGFEREESRKIAELLGSELVIVKCSRFHESAAPIIVAYLAQEYDDFSGRALLGNEMHYCDLRMYLYSDEALRAMTKYVQCLGVNVDLMNIASYLPKTLTWQIPFKYDEEIGEHVASVPADPDNEWTRDKGVFLSGVALSTGCYTNTLNEEFCRRLYDRYYMERFNGETRTPYRQEMEHTLWRLNHPLGRKHDWVEKINPTGTYGHKSREKTIPQLKKWGFRVNKNVPEMFKQEIWGETKKQKTPKTYATHLWRTHIKPQYRQTKRRSLQPVYRTSAKLKQKSKTYARAVYTIKK